MNQNYAADERILERFGYRQELKRTLGYFSSFALSFSVISVTTGLFANYGDGLRRAGPAFLWTWLIVGAGQFLVALVFARLAEAIPLSGYAYHWTRHLAGPRLAWWAGWMMIVQFLTGMPGVCYALANYLAPYLRLEPSARNLVLVTVGVLVTIALINHFGIRLASLVNDVSVGAEILGTVLIGLLLLVVALWRRTHSLGFLLTHPAQPPGWSYVGAFAFSSLMSAWTLTGFEGAANVAEETHTPGRHVPRAIVFSEVSSVVLGFLVLVGFTLAIPSLEAVSKQSTPLLFIISHYFPPAVTHATMLLVFISIFACALANLTTLTRMIWTMARDGQLPASHWLARVSAHQVPAHAIWTVTALSSAFVLWAKFEVVITGIATLAGFLTYALVVGATLGGPGLGARDSGLGRTESASATPSGGYGNMARISDSGNSKSQIANPKSKISKALSAAALAWILLLLAMLSLPRSAWVNSLATLAAIGAGALWYFLKRPAEQVKGAPPGNCSPPVKS
jgi:amino acid transporter